MTPRERAEKDARHWLRVNEVYPQEHDCSPSKLLTRSLASLLRSCAADALEAAAERYAANANVMFDGAQIGDYLRRMAAEARRET